MFQNWLAKLRLVSRCLEGLSGPRNKRPGQLNHLGVECILSKVFNLFLKARKKLFYLFINNFRAETKQKSLETLSRKEAEVFSSQSSSALP